MHHPPHRRSVWIGAGAAVVVAAVSISVAVLLKPNQARQTAAAADAPSSAVAALPVPTGPTVPAGPALRRLATQLADGTADTTSGAYSYVEVRSWSRSGLVPADGSLVPVKVLRTQTWSSGTGIARWVETDVTSACRPGNVSYVGGRVVDDLDVPPPKELNELRRLLQSSGAAGEPSRPVDLLWGYAMLAERQALRRPVRAALLQLLADVPGMTLREHARDRSGRPGIELDLRYGDGQGMTVRLTLVLDPATGALLAAFTGVVSSDPGAPADALRQYQAGVDTDYRLYEAACYTTNTTVPAAACSGP